jgi:hypothetical protein
MYWNPDTFGTTDPPLPYNFIALVGHGELRVVCIPMPVEIVRNFLPYEMELGAQNVTPPGTHPVIFFFYDMYDAHMTIPTLLPNLTYHEQILGVPFTYVKAGYASIDKVGPCFFMPQLYLNDYLATIGGRMYWGFAKNLARVDVNANSYLVSSLEGEAILKLEFGLSGPSKPAHEWPLIGPMQAIMTQPIVSQLPMALGPFVACSNFDKDWTTATVQPLKTVVNIYKSYVQGLPTGRYPAVGASATIAHSTTGSFVMKTEWRQGLIYPCCLAKSP